MPAETVRLHSIFDLAMRVGEGMLSNGAAASEVSATVLRITSSSGLRNVSVEVTFNQVALSYLADELSIPFTRIRAAGARVQDYARLSAFERITVSYIAGELSLEEARQQAIAIPQAKPHYPLALVAAGFALLGGGAAFGLGAGTLVMIAATIAGAILILLAEALGRRRIPMFYTQAVGGFVGVATAVVVALIDPSVNSSIVVVASIMVLLAGLTSIGAMQDAVTGWYITASGRILETLMLTVGLVAGVRFGLLLADALGADIAVSAALPISLASVLVLAVAGAAIGLGYAVGCHAPASQLPWMALVATGSSVVSHLLGGLFHDRVFASAATALLVGAVAVVLGDRFRSPALMYVMGGVIPLVPGLRIYRGLLALGSDVSAGAVELFGAAEIAIGLAAGAVLGQLLASRVVRRTRRFGIAHIPVISTPFTTLRRRRISGGARWRRRRGQGIVVEPSTMTGEMTALSPSLLEELEQPSERERRASDPEESA